MNLRLLRALTDRTDGSIRYGLRRPSIGQQADEGSREGKSGRHTAECVLSESRYDAPSQWSRQARERLSGPALYRENGNPSRPRDLRFSGLLYPPSRMCRANLGHRSSKFGAVRMPLCHCGCADGPRTVYQVGGEARSRRQHCEPCSVVDCGVVRSGMTGLDFSGESGKWREILDSGAENCFGHDAVHERDLQNPSKNLGQVFSTGT
ncbi:hypothetical protein QBC47DRAFT_7885 [Echria macrotheca]|uniref:Uncharacterized protein n=1 Tax=Echria macrotheca TaxID=438768 RepID=A0AAJ0FG23_9PEZI|nr:hypothetical protein QBC47DRAFT_7885 [Echria macrotheca]